VLEVTGLEVAYGKGEARVTVVRDLAMTARAGRITGIAGESGSGKTTAALAAIGYFGRGAERVGGEALFGGRSLYALEPRALRAVWGTGVSYVGQNAATALNPALKVGHQLVEVLRHGSGASARTARERALAALEAVRLPDPKAVMSKYPHEYSGGQLQRIAIAMGIAVEPALLVLDEPTTGLDVTTEVDVLDMLRDLIRGRAMAAVFISHDLAVLSNLSDELVMMYAGEVIESGPAQALTGGPRHPYTRALLDCITSADAAVRPTVLAGHVPTEIPEATCLFAPRCRWAVPGRCDVQHPQLAELGEGARRVRCLRTEELGELESASAELVGERPLRRLGTPLLSVESVRCTYRRAGREIVAVADVSLAVHPGEIVAVVGESGSGKTTVGRVITGILRPRSGAVVWEGQPLSPVVARRPLEQRRDIQVIFQNPDSSLNPRRTVGSQIARPIALFRRDVAPRDRLEAVHEALREVQLPAALADRYPDELSGGQKQRVAIARAFAVRPKLIVCDEIVSSQDVSVQAAILELVRTMERRYGTALLFISHDLGVVRSIADHVYVMRHGRIQEEGPTEPIFDAPAHPYTRELLAARAELHGVDRRIV
jgi:peptide/nickel transport system ATP-binding protein